MPKILIVEDDRFQNETLASWFTHRGYSVDQCFNCGDAATFLLVSTYDLILLDWELPDGDGVTMLRKQRHRGLATPVLILTGKSTLDDKELGFDSGADDYLTKPFQERELEARVKALLRRPPTYISSEIQVGDLTVCQSERIVKTRDGNLALTPREFEVFLFLARNLGTVFSPEAILLRAWDTKTETTSDNVRKYIQRIRSKLQNSSKLVSISTHHGLGYALQIEREEP
ncbi:MAG: response regulator transcription factor [Cyanobacteria bacterium]|nr:response regulator transcription factor [Cyanobacteriota bacterium]